MRSGFERVKAGWIRTRMWFEAQARTYIKGKNKKIRTVIVIHGPWGTGNLNIGQFFMDSFIHWFKTTRSSPAMRQALFQCQEQSGTTPDLDSDGLPALSIFWESCGSAGESLIFRFMGKFGFGIPASICHHFCAESYLLLRFSAQEQEHDLWTQRVLPQVLSLGKLCKLILENGNCNAGQGCESIVRKNVLICQCFDWHNGGNKLYPNTVYNSPLLRGGFLV